MNPLLIGIILRHKMYKLISSNLISHKYCSKMFENTSSISDHSLSSKVINNHFSQCPGDGKCASNHYLPIYLTLSNTHCKELCNRFQLHFPGNMEGLLTVDKGCFEGPQLRFISKRKQNTKNISLMIFDSTKTVVDGNTL